MENEIVNPWRCTKTDPPSCEERIVTIARITGPAVVSDPVLATDGQKLYVAVATQIDDRFYWHIQHEDDRIEAINAKRLIAWRELSGITLPGNVFVNSCAVAL